MTLEIQYLSQTTQSCTFPCLNRAPFLRLHTYSHRFPYLWHHTVWGHHPWKASARCYTPITLVFSMLSCHDSAIKRTLGKLNSIFVVERSALLRPAHLDRAVLVVNYFKQLIPRSPMTRSSRARLFALAANDAKIQYISNRFPSPIDVSDSINLLHFSSVTPLSLAPTDPTVKYKFQCPRHGCIDLTQKLRFLCPSFHLESQCCAHPFSPALFCSWAPPLCLL